MSPPKKFDKLESFAYTTGRMYAKYADRFGEDSRYCKYYMSLFPNGKSKPEEYAQYEAEFEEGKAHQEKILKEAKK